MTTDRRTLSTRRFWLFVHGPGWVSWRSYATERNALRWWDTYLERGYTVESKGWMDA